MRQLRLRVRKSTDRDAEAFRRHRKREMTVDPVGDEFARRRRQQRRLELIVGSSAAWGLVSAWFLAGGPGWVRGLKLATRTGFVVLACGAYAAEGAAVWSGTARSPSAGASAATSLLPTSAGPRRMASRERGEPPSCWRPGSGALAV